MLVALQMIKPLAASNIAYHRHDLERREHRSCQTKIGSVTLERGSVVMVVGRDLSGKPLPLEKVSHKLSNACGLPDHQVPSPRQHLEFGAGHILRREARARKRLVQIVFGGDDQGGSRDFFERPWPYPGQAIQLETADSP